MDEASFLDFSILDTLADLMSEDQFLSLIDAFYATLNRIAPELIKENQSSETINALAHELKGMAGNMGFSGLSAFMIRFEIPSNDVTFTNEDRHAFKNMIQESQNELNLFLKERGLENNTAFLELIIDPQG